MRTAIPTAAFLLLGCLLTQSAAAFSSFSVGGLTYHGYHVDSELAHEMPNKINDDGKWVRHTQQYTYQQSSGSSLFTAAYLKDCFNMPAFWFGLGHQWGQNFKVGYAAGFYTRRRYVFTDEDGGLATPQEFPLTITHNNWQIMPIIFVGASYLYPIDDFRGIILSAASNYFINNFQVGTYWSLK